MNVVGEEGGGAGGEGANGEGGSGKGGGGDGGGVGVGDGGGGDSGGGSGGPTCCGFREHPLGSAAVARGVEPPSVRGSVVEHGVAVIFLVELGHGSWRREVLDSGAARQPEVLRAIVEALQRPSIAWLGLG